jgi:hypothetical protein
MEAHQGELPTVRGGGGGSYGESTEPGVPGVATVGRADQRHSRVRAREEGVIWEPRLSRAVAELFGLRLQCQRMGEKGK